jgi:hypothetical protein
MSTFIRWFSLAVNEVTNHRNLRTCRNHHFVPIGWNSSYYFCIIIIFFSWSELWDSPLCTVAIVWPIVPATDDIWWLWNNQCDANCQRKPKYSKKTFPSATLSTTNPTRSDPDSNPGSRGGKPATNRLSYGRPILSDYSSILFRDIERNELRHYGHRVYGHELKLGHPQIIIIMLTTLLLCPVRDMYWLLSLHQLQRSCDEMGLKSV